MGNSDFFMGAFPAEYGNALSSVFDLSIRTGNTSKYNHSLQIGALGLDAASEGPFAKKTNASYLFNYRYSTLSLLRLGIDYQDFSFKLNFPTKNAGTFSIWGLGLIDGVYNKPDTDTLNVDTKWQYYEDITTERAKLSTGVGGLSHKIMIAQNGFLKSTATVSYNSLDFNLNRLNSIFTTNFPQKNIEYKAFDYHIASTLNYKLGKNTLTAQDLFLLIRPISSI